MSFTTKQMSVLETTLQNLSGENGELVEFTGLVLDKIRVMNEKKTRGRVAKDADRVKRPTHASWMFRDENRAKIIAEHFGGQKTKGSDVAKKAKELWDAMSEEERKPWTDRHAELWSAYKAANPSRGAKSTSPKSPQVKRWDWTPGVAPEGWSAPHNGKYLLKNAVKWGGWGVGKFPTFLEAVDAANALDTCGGITYNKKHGYQLRVGTKGPMTPQAERGEFCVSWVKNK